MKKEFGKCETCAKCAMCKQTIGFMFGGCRSNYVPIEKPKCNKPIEYAVKWRDIGDLNETIVFETDDQKKAYDYAKKNLPHRKECLIYHYGKLEYQFIRA